MKKQENTLKRTSGLENAEEKQREVMRDIQDLRREQREALRQHLRVFERMLKLQVRNKEALEDFLESRQERGLPVPKNANAKGRAWFVDYLQCDQDLEMVRELLEQLDARLAAQSAEEVRVSGVPYAVPVKDLVGLQP